jgi:predicted hotdog family 3-hydroxylacyl-ACP dehydratase
MTPSNPRTQPQTLDHAGIAARVPHAGAMCLLDRLLRWDDRHIVCMAVGHRDRAHPLRDDGALPAPAAIEYASQAMALHGTLSAPPGSAPRPGMLASVRNVRLLVPRLDDVAGPLQVHCERLAGDERQAMYAFSVSAADDGRMLVDGRATVVLDAVGPR